MIFILIVISCGIPPNGTNTEAVPQTSLSYEGTYNYTCITGYESTSLTTMCLSDTTWSLPNGAECNSKCRFVIDFIGLNLTRAIHYLQNTTNKQGRYKNLCTPMFNCLIWRFSEAYKTLYQTLREVEACGKLCLKDYCSLLLEVPCGTPPDGVNTVTPTDSLSYQDTYDYTCLTGYKTKDIATTECLADGSFKLKTPPTCTSKWLILYSLSLQRQRFMFW